MPTLRSAPQATGQTSYVAVPTGAAIGTPKKFSRPHLLYYGGPVLSNVKVYLVAWGQTGDATQLGRLASFYADITNSPYFDWLSEYDTAGRIAEDGKPGSSQTIGRGSFGGIFTITPSNSAARISSRVIADELAAQLKAGHLPAPDLDGLGNVNAYYAIQFPGGVTIADANIVSCRDYCAYHDSVLVDGRSVPYGVLPAPVGGCAMGCGPETDPFDNLTSTHSHELIEAVTDPAVGQVTGNNNVRPFGWLDARGWEIADLCDNSPNGRVAGWVVEKGWSNRFFRCLAVAP